MLRVQSLLTLLLTLNCLCNHVTGVEGSPTSKSECGENQYLSEDDGKCYPCQEFTCPAGYEQNLSCGSGEQLTGQACIKCQDGFFSRAGENCQRCSVCRNTVNDTPCTSENDIICGACKEGFVMLGFSCRSCNVVPYPSRYEECESNGRPSGMEKIPVPYTVAQTVKAAPVGKGEGPEPPSEHFLLVVFILAGLILLVGLVIILIIVICYNYRRHGTCSLRRGIGPPHPAPDIHVDGNLEGLNTTADGHYETDSLTQGSVVDSQPDQSFPSTSVVSETSEHSNGGRVQLQPLLTPDDASHEQQPDSVDPTNNIASTDTVDGPEEHGDSIDGLSSGEDRSRQPDHRSYPSSPGGNSQSGGSSSHQLCSGCLSRKEAGVSITTAQHVHIYNGCNGQCSSHRSTQADRQGNITFNPTFNPSW